MSMIHPAKNPQPGGFDLATFAPSLDGEAGEALGEFLSHFEDPMCDECDSGITESQLMGRLKEALDQRDEARENWRKAADDADHFEKLHKLADEAHSFMVGQNNKLRRALDQAFPQCYDAVVAALNLGPADTAKAEAAILKVQQSLTR